MAPTGFRQRHGAQVTDILLRCLGRAISKHLQTHGGGEATDLGQQMTHGNVRRGDRISHAEPRQVALDWRIELNLSSFNQLHDRQGGK